MSALVMNGEVVADDVKRDLITRIEALVDRGVTPGLGTILVGDDGPSAKYVAMKHADASQLGIHTREIHLAATASQDEVGVAIEVMNNDPRIDAYIVQYPFPAGLDYERALLEMDPSKDADGLHPVNLGLLVMGSDAPVACTPAGILRLLEYYEVPINGRHVVIVGRGLTIGRPLANLLALKRPETNAAVTVVHTGVADLASYVRQGDIVVAAAGSAGLVTAEMVQPGAAVVAAGVSFADGKLTSDVSDQVAEVAGWISPRVGGVGPMTRAMLMANTVAARGTEPVMTRISDLLSAGPTVSVEFFPPKTPAGMAQLDTTIGELAPLELSFVSVTYGAGGSTRDTTRDIVVRVNEEQAFPAMPHLTCMNHTIDEIETLLDDYAANGVTNILALAGDPPADGSPVTGDFTYASELVELARRRPEFSIAVAAQPELHPRSHGDRAADRARLAEKLEQADFAITNFFFDVDDYFRMVDELDALGCTKPVLPGVMPLLNTTTIRRFSKMNDSAFPEELGARIDAAADEAEVMKIAVEAAAELSQQLLDGGVPGLHVYALNRSEATRGIISALGLR